MPLAVLHPSGRGMPAGGDDEAFVDEIPIATGTKMTKSLLIAVAMLLPARVQDSEAASTMTGG